MDENGWHMQRSFHSPLLLAFPFLSIPFSLPSLSRCADTVLNQVRQRDKQVGSGDTALLGK